MDDIAKVVDLIGKTGSTLDKQFLLKKNENLPGLKEVLKFIYNPYVRTGISSAKLAKALQRHGAEVDLTYLEALKYFTAHTTGTDVDLVVAEGFVSCTRRNHPDAVWLAEAIITQDLKIGLTSTTLNKVFGDTFIPKVGCMLGTKYNDVGPKKTKWPCIVTEKLDGIRRILVKENGVCRFYSRSGHEDVGLVDIAAEARFLPNNRVYDGELLAEGTFKDSIALRQATNSIGATKGEKHGLVFNIFDMMAVEDFYKGASDENALTRKILLGSVFKDESIQLLTDDWAQYIAMYAQHEHDFEHIRSVPILGLIQNFEEVGPIVSGIWDAGGEGVMLNTCSGKYEIKRSKNLLKVKQVKEYTLKVVGMIEGSGKFEDMLGALIVDYNGAKVGVGSGFDDAQRLHIWNNQDEFIDQYVEIDSFGESDNALGGKSLNCPIFKRFVGVVE